MSNKTKAYKKNSKSKRETSALLLLPLMAVVGVVPLIVRLYVYDSGLEYFDFFQSAAVLIGAQPADDREEHDARDGEGHAY